MIYTQSSFMPLHVARIRQGMAAFSCKINIRNNLMKSTSKKTYILWKSPHVITHSEVIKEIEINDLNVLFLNLSSTFKVLFTIFGYECIVTLQC